MAGGSNGYRAVLVRRRLTPGLISSSPGTAGLPLFFDKHPKREPRDREACEVECSFSRGSRRG